MLKYYPVGKTTIYQKAQLTELMMTNYILDTL